MMFLPRSSWMCSIVSRSLFIICHSIHDAKFRAPFKFPYMVAESELVASVPSLFTAVPMYFPRPPGCIPRELSSKARSCDLR